MLAFLSPPTRQQSPSLHTHFFGNKKKETAKSKGQGDEKGAGDVDGAGPEHPHMWPRKPGKYLDISKNFLAPPRKANVKRKVAASVPWPTREEKFVPSFSQQKLHVTDQPCTHEVISKYVRSMHGYQYRSLCEVGCTRIYFMWICEVGSKYVLELHQISRSECLT